MENKKKSSKRIYLITLEIAVEPFAFGTLIRRIFFTAIGKI